MSILCPSPQLGEQALSAAPHCHSGNLPFYREVWCNLAVSWGQVDWRVRMLAGWITYVSSLWAIL